MIYDINSNKPTSSVHEKKLLHQSHDIIPDLGYEKTERIACFPEILAFFLQDGFLTLFTLRRFWIFQLFLVCIF